jgi:hypothetical protein
VCWDGWGGVGWGFMEITHHCNTSLSYSNRPSGHSSPINGGKVPWGKKKITLKMLFTSRTCTGRL